MNTNTSRALARFFAAPIAVAAILGGAGVATAAIANATVVTQAQQRAHEQERAEHQQAERDQRGPGSVPGVRAQSPQQQRARHA